MKNLIPFLLLYPFILYADNQTLAPHSTKGPTVASQIVKQIPKKNYTASVFAASKAGRQWLSLLDAGKYEQAWMQAAELVRKNVPKKQFIDGAKGIRTKLGPLEKRTLVSAQFKEQLPGAPKGQYAILEFKSKFQHKDNVIEILTPQKEPDGKWRIAAYFVN